MFAQLKKKLFLVGAMIILGLSSVFAQDTSTVSGTITDTNGAVIVGATVRALNIASSRETNVETDGAGKYEFTDLRPGSYRISAIRQGFATNAKTVLLEQGASRTQDFSLSPGVIEDVVTVTAGKGSERIAVEVPQTVTVATAEDIERQRPRSTFEAIERAPNIIVRETNPARERPRLRGLDSSRVLIVIDGEKLNNARTDLQTGLSPSIIDVTQIEAAEVVAGAGSSLYGSDSLAGTINLVTKGPNRPDKGYIFGARLDGNHSSNGRVNRGGAVFNLSNKFAAFRASGSLFRNSNYSIGNRAITIEEVIQFGRFFTRVPSNIPNPTAVPPIAASFNGPGSYAVFSVPAGGEILNGAGHGGNGQVDLWVYPTEKHSFRGRYIISQHRNLGDAFSGPPYETQERFNPFREYDKFGLRYEGLDLSRFVPRVSVNYYYQKLSFPQAQFDYTNQAASVANPNGSFMGANFTGRPSRFTLNTFTSNQNTISTNNIDAQATLLPFKGMLVTAGAQYLEDSSRDAFNNNGFFNFDRNQPNFVTNFQRGASSPDTKYQDRAVFFQAEYDGFKFLRLSGGLRVDNWKTEATPSPDFPLRFEFGVLTASLPQLQANPGPLTSQVASIPQLSQLASRSGAVSTNNTTVTGNFGVVARLPYGINPYFRYGTSYREPSITERYILRNFPAFPGLVALVAGNPNLEPETGRNVDVGIKFQGSRYSGSFGYFRNDLKNLIIFQTPDFGNICVAPNPSIGLLPLSVIFVNSARPCAVGQSAISFNGRINQADNVISGFEGIGEYSISLNDFGSITPFVSFGTLKGVNKSPTPLRLYQLSFLQNLQDKPFELEGSADDFPLGNITPFRIIGGAQYADRAGRIFAEYSFRHQARVKRIDPNSLTGTTLVNYGTFANLNSFTKHTVKGGYTWRYERYRMSLNAGIENFTDELFFEHFQTAPAPGRSFVFGFTVEVFNFFKN